MALPKTINKFAGNKVWLVRALIKEIALYVKYFKHERNFSFCLFFIEIALY